MMLLLPRFGGAKARVEAWNKANPIGTAVVVIKDDGTAVDSKTTSKAQMLGGHTPVIWCEGISGCYALDRVKRKA